MRQSFVYPFVPGRIARDPSLTRFGTRCFFLLTSFLAILTPAPATAQLAFIATATTNEVFRGQSISGDKPALGLGASYDFPNGFFVGANGSISTEQSGFRLNSGVQYLGYAIRRGRTSIETGLVFREYRRPHDEDYSSRYVEVFVGVTSPRGTVRIYASPNYSRAARATYYAEANFPLYEQGDWSLSGHVGLSAIPTGHAAHGSLQPRPDWKLEAGRTRRGFSLAAGVASTTYPVFTRTGHPRVYFSLSQAF